VKFWKKFQFKNWRLFLFSDIFNST